MSEQEKIAYAEFWEWWRGFTLRHGLDYEKDWTPALDAWLASKGLEKDILHQARSDSKFPSTPPSGIEGR